MKFLTVVPPSSIYQINSFIKTIFTTQNSHVINPVRAEATEEGLKIITCNFMKHVTKQKTPDDFIFNMDKTGLVR